MFDIFSLVAFAGIMYVGLIVIPTVAEKLAHCKFDSKGLHCSN